MRPARMRREPQAKRKLVAPVWERRAELGSGGSSALFGVTAGSAGGTITSNNFTVIDQHIFIGNILELSGAPGNGGSSGSGNGGVNLGAGAVEAEPWWWDPNRCSRNGLQRQP